MAHNHAQDINARDHASVHIGNNYNVQPDNKDEECIRALLQTDPSHDKDAIVDLKGGLFDDRAFKWIFYHDHYIRWLNGDGGNVLWIRGDAGKGKTMMLCEIIHNLAAESSDCLSYFFCQATNQKMNNATAVLRGLIYGLIRRGYIGGINQTVLSYIRKEFDLAGPSLFDGPTSWQAISKILKTILRHKSMRGTVLVVDALDECEDDDDRSRLLKFIVQTSCDMPWLKWAVTSRKMSEITVRLCETDSGERTITIDLEKEEASVSKAVHMFINKRLGRLPWWNDPDNEDQKQILNKITEKADNTFLWAALVCQELEKTPQVLALDAIKDIPQGLDDLYERMLRNIRVPEQKQAKLTKTILATVLVAKRPLSLGELASMVETLYRFRENVKALTDSVQRCGSFLTLRKETVFIVHQSAKEFLENRAQAELMPFGIAKQHHQIFTRSLEVLSATLKRNIGGLEVPGSPASASSQNHSSLKLVTYACVYWVDHFGGSNIETAKENDAERGDVLIDGFLHDHLLHWLEAVSLLNSMPKAVSSLRDLKYLLANTNVSRLRRLVQDAHRFVLSHRASIEVAPLQVYASALVFSPVQSVVRQHFETEAPAWITKNSIVEEEWDDCIQVLEGHKESITTMVFSADNSFIASGSADGSLRIWDAATGACVEAFHIEENAIDSIAFSADRGLLCSVRRLYFNPLAKCIRIWDPKKGEFKEMAYINDCLSAPSTLSIDGKWLACRTSVRTIGIWDTESGISKRLETENGVEPVRLVFSRDNKWLVSGPKTLGTVTIWSTTNWEYERKLEDCNRAFYSFALSDDCRLLASNESDGSVIMWDFLTGIQKHSFQTGHEFGLFTLSCDGRLLATDSDARGQYWIWDTTTGQHLRTLSSNQQDNVLAAFSADGQRLVLCDTSIEVWDLENRYRAQVPPHHAGKITSVALSANLRWAASGSDDHTIRIWDVEKMVCTKTLTGHAGAVEFLSFFSDDHRLLSQAIFADGAEFLVWDFKTGAGLDRIYDGEDGSCFAVSPDGKNLAIVSGDCMINVWDLEAKGPRHSLRVKSAVESIAFSVDCQQLISIESDGTIEIWAVGTWECPRTLKTGIIHPGHFYTTLMAISSNSQLLVVGCREEDSHSTLVMKNLETGNSVSSDCFCLNLGHLVFDKENDHRLNTNVGAFDLHSCASGEEQAGSCAMEMRRNGYGISCDNKWIVKNEQRMLWIPEKHRPLVSAMIGSTLIIGCQSGHVQRMTFLMDDSHSRNISTTAPAKSRDRSTPVSAPPSKRQRVHRA